MRSLRAGEVAQRLQSSISPVTVVFCLGLFARTNLVATHTFSVEIVRLFSFTAPIGPTPTFLFQQHPTDSARFLRSQIPVGFILSAGVSSPRRLKGEFFLSILQTPPNMPCGDEPARVRVGNQTASSPMLPPSPERLWRTGRSEATQGRLSAGTSKRLRVWRTLKMNGTPTPKPGPPFGIAEPGKRAGLRALRAIWIPRAQES